MSIISKLFRAKLSLIISKLGGLRGEDGDWMRGRGALFSPESKKLMEKNRGNEDYSILQTLFC